MTLDLQADASAAIAPGTDGRNDVLMSQNDIRLLLDPWYHDFAPLGLRTPQRAGIFRPNQAAKQPVLCSLIDQALALCRQSNPIPRGVELFCADGFYANYAAQKGAEVLGVDLDLRDLAKAALITRVLGNDDRVRVLQQDVFELEGRFDFGICAGGLYHLSNPEELLNGLLERVTTALVIQTVYSLEKTDPEYFETPAPGWTWGSRFSYTCLETMVKRAGWRAVAAMTNELGGNEKLQDRGSAYFLCVPDATDVSEVAAGGISNATMERFKGIQFALPGTQTN